MSTPGHEKTGQSTESPNTALTGQTIPQQRVGTMPKATIPARFRQEHEGDDAIFLANEHSGPWVDADEVVLPHNGTGLTPLFNLQVGVIEGTLPEIREAITEALDWLHRIEAQLPGGTEVNQ